MTLRTWSLLAVLGWVAIVRYGLGARRVETYYLADAPRLSDS